MFDRLIREPRFWPLQAVGWTAFAGLVMVDILPRLRDLAALAYDALFVSSLFVSSLVLRVACRRIASDDTPWLKAMLKVGPVAFALGIPCGILAEWVDNGLLRGHSTSWMLVFEAWGTMVFGTFVLLSWSALYLGMKHYRAFQMEQERALRAEMLVREARLETLRYQLNPHFLFNTLNAISTLVVEGDSMAASRMLVQLSSFLRLTLDRESANQISLGLEVANAKQYLEIEKARLGQRLELEWSISPDAESSLVPALLLQPLVENAIRHGISPKPSGGKLSITAERKDNRVRIAVEDNGVGPQSKQDTFDRPRHGLGLSNTLERLRVRYGPDHQVALKWPPQGGCSVEIELPYEPAVIDTYLSKGALCAS